MSRAQRTASRFMPRIVTKRTARCRTVAISEVEELHLHRELVRGVARVRTDARVGPFDVEVVPVRQPGQTGLEPFVVAGVVGGGTEILVFRAEPRHDLRGRQVVAHLRRYVSLLRNGGEGLASVEVKQRELAVKGVLVHGGNGREDVRGVALVVLLVIEAGSERKNSLVSEINAGIEVAGLLVPYVVLEPASSAQTVAGADRTKALKAAGAVFEVAIGQIALGLKPGIAADG